MWCVAIRMKRFGLFNRILSATVANRRVLPAPKGPVMRKGAAAVFLTDADGEESGGGVNILSATHWPGPVIAIKAPAGDRAIRFNAAVM